MMSYFFGDNKTAFAKEQFYGVKTSQELLRQPELVEMQKQLSFTGTLKTLITVHQTHSTDGLIIKSLEDALAYKPYSNEADFIITNVPNVAISVATADCLPIIFYDPKKQVIAIAHAGWQGSVAGIAPKVARVMHQAFGVNYDDIQIIFGPCASFDAYEVGADFGKNIVGLAQKDFDEVFLQKNGAYYFNLVLYNQRLLEQLGIKNFNHDHNHCTIINHAYCSHRRECGLAKRQISIVVY